MLIMLIGLDVEKNSEAYGERGCCETQRGNTGGFKSYGPHGKKG
jgi:hypothetical protein